MPNSNSSQDLRLLVPETIWLEPEHFLLAKQTSSPNMNQGSNSWQIYLNILALAGFEVWLRENLPNKYMIRNLDYIAAAGNLQVEKYKFSTIATEHLLDEIVNIPKELIDKPELAAHFYVVLEVLEEEEEVLIRGFLPYNQLINIKSNLQLHISDGCYQIPLALFDIEPNHLLIYQRYVESFEFALPVVGTQVNSIVPISENVSKLLDSTTTKLSQWLQGVVDESWQVIDYFSNSELNLAFRCINLEQETKRAKIIDLKPNLDTKQVALLVNISPKISFDSKENKTQKKISVLTQLYPMGGERFLAQNIKFILRSKAGKVIQEVNSRIEDNYIQLKRFKGEPGKQFTIQISLDNVTIKEHFEF